MLVLLAACNGSTWIRDQVASILAQEEVEVSVLIRDDYSRDSTLEELDQFRNDDRLTILANSNPTGSAARNFFALIREAAPGKHDFVALADQDDIWHPQRLSRACRTLRETGSVAYSSATLAFWPNGRTAILRQSPKTTPADFLFEGAGQGCTFVLTASFYRKLRQFLTANSGLTEFLHYHDWTIYALARAWGHAWTFDPLPTVFYRQHARNDTGARVSKTAMRKRLSLVKSGWYRNQISLITEVCMAAAPDNLSVSNWKRTSEASTPRTRRVAIARFCLTDGRRKFSDRLVLSFFALLGWL